MENFPFLAIDFGTTNSVMAWVNPDGQAEVINNAEGEPKTPSLVYYGEGGTLVGKYAASFIEDEMRFLDPDAQQRETARVMRSVKRLLGQATLIALPGGLMLRPVDVAAEIFKKLKQDAEDGIFHEPLRRAVVTYPAAFDPTQQQAIEQAARQAGFEDVRLLAEPEAAALAYTRLGRAVGEGVLVYDLGGGTFDLSVLSRDSDEGMYRLALENEGDARLGGDDIDQLLHDHCLKLAAGQLGADLPAFDINFLYDCRKRKENLSGSAAQTFSSLFNGRPFRHKMERGEFEALIEPLIGRTVRKTQQMLKRAEDAGVKVDTLVLIGGSSRIPLIERRLEEVLPVAPFKFHQADCAVALGAAFYTLPKSKLQPSIQNETDVYQGTKPTLSVPLISQAEIPYPSKASLVNKLVSTTSGFGSETDPTIFPCLRITLQITYQSLRFIKDIAFSPDSCLLAAASSGSNSFQNQGDAVWIWRTGKQNLVHKIYNLTDEGCSNLFTCVAFSHNGKWLAASASGSDSSSVRLWKVEDGTLVRTMNRPTSTFNDTKNSVAFSPDGQWLTSASCDNRVPLWRVADGTLVRTLEGHRFESRAVAFSPDSQLLASRSNSTVRLWRIADGTLVRTMEGHIGSIAFSPDGRWLASGADNNMVRLCWVADDRELVRTFTGHSKSVNCVAFSPDGRWLVSGSDAPWLFAGSDDKKLLLWRVADGSLVQTLTGHTKDINCVAFSPNGQWLASGSSDMTVRLWKIESA
jgi:WD40 repeat protein/actin-like ATPase involved in cell morphogenesis